MKAVQNTRRLSRFYKPPISLSSEHFLSPEAPVAEALQNSFHCRNITTFSSQSSLFPGIILGNHFEIENAHCLKPHCHEQIFLPKRIMSKAIQKRLLRSYMIKLSNPWLKSGQWLLLLG